MFFLVSGLRAGDDCSRSADACSPQIKKITPFMAAVKKAQKAPELKQGASQVIALKQGEPKVRLVAASTASVPAPAAADRSEPAAPAARSEGNETLSKPAWLLAVAALLAGLYYFLREGKGGKKRA